MAHSLEVRVPFLDKEVFDFAAKLPKEAKIAAGTTKYIFRKAVSEFFHRKPMNVGNIGFFQFQSVCGCGRMTGIRG